MQKKYVLQTLAVCLFMPQLSAMDHHADRPTNRPNIVLYVADDLGWQSVNATGADPKFVQTPHINELAAEGINFSNARATASVCSPTRYAMLTGEYSWRTPLKKGVVGPASPLMIALETETLGSYLQQRGYRTAAVGKWHLGYLAETYESQDLLGSIDPGANDVGFDYHFGVPNNFDDLKKVYIENDRIWGLRSHKIEPYGMSFYRKPYVGFDAPQRVSNEVMEFTTQKAIDWINEPNASEPFFMYFSAVAVHHPIIPSERFKGSSGAGLYGDFIHDIDYSLGQIVAELKEKGIFDNTIFIFTSDNGGDLPGKSTTPERIAYEKGFHFNGPVKGDKHQIYDGGLRVPFIVRWPAKISAGSKSDALISTVDIFATVAELLDGTTPDPAVAAPDSFSFAHLLSQPRAESHRPFLVHRDARGRQALLKGQWKLVDNVFPENDGKESNVRGAKELYDLSKDFKEAHNVYKLNPEVAKELEDLLDTIRNTPASRTKSYN